jgi:NADH-quinone oxidoreductase subunit C
MAQTSAPNLGAPADAAEPEAPPPPPTDVELVIDRFPGAVVPRWRFADGIPTAGVAPELICDVITWLRHRPDGGRRYDMLVDVSGSHWPDRTEPYEVTYLLHALDDSQRIRVKVAVGGDHPSIPSIAGVWALANWPEREIYDMFGVEFTGHPDLRRIITPNDWEGHPLRKDFPLGEEPVEFQRP